jgi:hypothetical protein
MTEKRSNFIRIAEARTSRALQAIRTIGNLANRSNYEFSEDDVRKIRRALLEEVEVMTKRFTVSESRSRPVFKLEE